MGHLALTILNESHINIIKCNGCDTILKLTFPITLLYSKYFIENLVLLFFSSYLPLSVSFFF